MIRRAVGFLDGRLGAGSLLRSTLRYVFPDHWSFMLGEIALYAFVVLVGTGIFLTFFYVPSDEVVRYSGDYGPLVGREVGRQFDSVMAISFDVPAGLLIRQTHHWAADVFVVAIVLHVVRIVLTGAFRKPRELNYLVGVTLLGVAILEGFLGYSLVDDLLSGMGLAIAYSVLMAVPVAGASAATLVWGAQYPGDTEFWSRVEIVHVLILPVLIATLIGLHLAQLARQHHTQFAGPRRGERRLVGTPLWPGYALRSIALLLIVTAFLFLLGGLVQINPIWEWGPYETGLSTNGAQPDWYLGWLIGALRLMPPLEIRIGDYTLVPNPFFGGALFPTVVFGVLYLMPWIDRRWLGRDPRAHNVLDRPRDSPRRTAFFCAFLAWVFVIFAAGAADRIYVQTLVSYEGQVWFFRAAALALPVVAFVLVKRVCEELLARERHPLRRYSGAVIERRADGSYRTVAPEAVRRRTAGYPSKR